MRGKITSKVVQKAVGVVLLIPAWTKACMQSGMPRWTKYAETPFLSDGVLGSVRDPFWGLGAWDLAPVILEVYAVVYM